MLDREKLKHGFEAILENLLKEKKTLEYCWLTATDKAHIEHMLDLVEGQLNSTKTAISELS